MKLINKLIDLLNYNFSIGSVTLTPKTILIVILVFLLTSFLLKIVRKIIFRTLAKDTRLKFKSIFSFANYFIYVVVILIILQNIGVDVTAIFLKASFCSSFHA